MAAVNVIACLEASTVTLPVFIKRMWIDVVQGAMPPHPPPPGSDAYIYHYYLHV